MHLADLMCTLQLDSWLIILPVVRDGAGCPLSPPPPPPPLPPLLLLLPLLSFFFLTSGWRGHEMLCKGEE